MWAYLFAVVLVGIPGAAGAYRTVGKLGRDNVSNGVTLVVYAIALTAMFVYVLPIGPLSGAPNKTIMPTALIVCLVVGAIAGLIRRWRHKSG